MDCLNDYMFMTKMHFHPPLDFNLLLVIWLLKESFINLFSSVNELRIQLCQLLGIFNRESSQWTDNSFVSITWFSKSWIITTQWLKFLTFIQSKHLTNHVYVVSNEYKLDQHILKHDWDHENGLFSKYCFNPLIKVSYSVLPNR